MKILFTYYIFIPVIQLGLTSAPADWSDPLQLENVKNTDFSGNIFSETIKYCNTSFDIFKLFKDFTKTFGFTDFIVRKFPGDDDKYLRDLIIISSWPPELINEYDELGLMVSSLAYSKVRKSSTPYFWNFESIAENRSNETANLAKELFQGFGHYNGVHIPVSDSSGRRIIVSFSGNRAPLERHELLEAFYFATCVNDRFAEIEEPLNFRKSQLSDRELECLKWSARGKTSFEIGTILDISENTVNKYISFAIKKLNCVNKTHAVAECIYQNLIESDQLTQ